MKKTTNIKKVIISISVCVTAIMLSSCDSSSSSPSQGPTSGDTSEQAIDPELKPSYDIFIAEALARNVNLNSDEFAFRLANLKLQWGQIPADSLAECGTNSDDPSLVKITVSEELRGAPNLEHTIIHELGHCILHMEHRDGVLSIMNTDYTDELDAADRNDLYDEFFQAQFFNNPSFLISPEGAD